MAAVTYDFTIEQGATLREIITWTNADGTPINITGWTGRLQARADIDSPTKLLDLTTANGGIIIGGSNGQLTIFMSDTQTSALTWSGSSIYDLELVAPGGDVTRLLKGTITLDREVTR